MDNPEEILQALDQFSRLKPNEIPTELEQYLRYVAKTGDPVYQWSLIKPLYVQKLNNVMTEFFESSPILEIPPSPNVEPFSYERMKTILLEKLETFMNAPFTIQRISELLVSPRSEYNRIDKYMRAVEKNVLVVSTRDTTRSHSDNDKNQEAVNGIPENNGTTEDVDVNMLNTELGLQNPPHLPADDLPDIKADELEMDSLLIENMPDDKWVKHDITSDLGSVVSIATNMTSQSTVLLSNDRDLVPTKSGSIAQTIPLEVMPERMTSPPMSTETDPALEEPEPMSAITETLPTTSESIPTEPIPPISETVPSVMEPVPAEPMAIEPPIEAALIDTNEMVPDVVQTASDSMEVSNSQEAIEIPVTHAEQPDLTLIDSCMPDSNTATEKMSLLADESMPIDQLPVAGEVTSTLNVLLTENNPTESLIDDSMPPVAEHDDTKNESEMLIESSTDAKAVKPDVQTGSEAQATITEVIPEMSAAVPETSTTSTSETDSPTSKEGVSTTTDEPAGEDKSPIVTIPEDEAANNAPPAAISESAESATSSGPSEDILVTLLAENESLGSTDEVITATPVVTEPQETPIQETATSASAEVTEV